jgi:ribose 5-phosphate isomerase B
MKAVAIGCDPNAAELKSLLIQHLQALGYEVEDYGADDPIYANVAFAVAEAVAAGKHDRGILICGTGIGMSLAANKVPGAYAALCADAYSAERARKSNNANIMTLGARLSTPNWPRPWSPSGWPPSTSRAVVPSPKSSASTNTPANTAPSRTARWARASGAHDRRANTGGHCRAYWRVL